MDTTYGNKDSIDAVKTSNITYTQKQQNADAFEMGPKRFTAQRHRWNFLLVVLILKLLPSLIRVKIVSS